VQLPQIGKPKIEVRLDSFGQKSAAKPVSAAVGSMEHKIRLAFQSTLKMDIAGQESFYLLLARGLSGVIAVIVLQIVGLPFLTSLVGLIAGTIFVNGWITRAWNKTRTDLEAELPSLLMRLNSVIAIAPNLPSALEIVSRTLKRGGPLANWSAQVSAKMHNEGHGALDPIRADAAIVSTSLAIAVELIGRMWTTGGEGYAKAFGAAADNLESVLDARVQARAKGSSAQGTVNLLTGMTFLMIGFMNRSPALAASASSPLVQALYAGLCLVIVFGHSQISDIIDKAV
jgi:Flp pilus assembly protein TadB